MIHDALPEADGALPAKPSWGDYLESFLKAPGRAKAALVGCLILMLLSPSGLSAMTPFVIPAYASATGTSTVATVLLFTTAPLIVAPLVLPFAGRRVDRLGARRIAIPMTVAYAVATALVPAAGAVPVLLAITLVLASVFGFAASLAVVFKVVSGWFPKHRGVGFALLGVVSSLAGTFLSPIFQWLINGSSGFGGLGWDGTYYVVAVAIVVLAVPSAVWLIREPARSRTAAQDGTFPDVVDLPGASFGEAVRSRVWMLIAVFLALAAAGPMAVRQNSVDFYGKHGFDPATVAIALSVLFAASVAGLLVGGLVMDRSSRPWVVVPMLAAVPCGLLISQLNDGSVPLLFLATGLLGFATGAESSLGPYLIARYFGLKAFGQIQGLTLVFSTLALGVSPFVVSAMSVSTGGYTVPVLTLTVVTFLAAGLAALLPRYPNPGQETR